MSPHPQPLTHVSALVVLVLAFLYFLIPDLKNSLGIPEFERFFGLVFRTNEARERIEKLQDEIQQLNIDIEESQGQTDECDVADYCRYSSLYFYTLFFQQTHIDQSPSRSKFFVYLHRKCLLFNNYFLDLRFFDWSVCVLLLWAKAKQNNPVSIL